MTTCPVCLSIDGFDHREGGTWGFANQRHECELCGLFGTTHEARDDYLGESRARTTRLVRASLSHWIRKNEAVKGSDNIPVVTSELIEAAVADKLRLPSPGEQANNIVRLVGDATRVTGAALTSLSPNFHATVGSVSRKFAHDLVFELANEGILAASDSSTLNSHNAHDVRLTLRGWERYEKEQRGGTAGNYGFMALKFGDVELDGFLQTYLKPAVAELGFELRDMRDNARAGVIDNLMRIDIRDAAFVIADLSHDNHGAYWEAGYAEGLGKPVLYICEKSKFETFKTHFDTNHSTTVLWDAVDPQAFREQFVATLRRSLI